MCVGSPESVARELECSLLGDGDRLLILVNGESLLERQGTGAWRGRILPCPLHIWQRLGTWPGCGVPRVGVYVCLLLDLDSVLDRGCRIVDDFQVVLGGKG